jgi:hypothetical protein
MDSSWLEDSRLREMAIRRNHQQTAHHLRLDVHTLLCVAPADLGTDAINVSRRGMLVVEEHISRVCCFLEISYLKC